MTMTGEQRVRIESIRAYAQREVELLQSAPVESIASLATHILDAYHAGRSIFCIGNGGSAATAAHFATDLSWGQRHGVAQPPHVVSLTSNTAMITAVGNDIGFEHIFVEQLRSVFQPGDVLLAITASGNSPNIMRAAAFVKTNGGCVLGVVGFDGGRLPSLCDASVHIQTEAGAYELVEDVHHAVCHMIARVVKESIVTEQQGSPELLRTGHTGA
jgi:D-sedoheptulose 7-phosphate isomerase